MAAMAAPESTSIPTLDLSPYLTGDRERTEALVRSIDRACAEVGFLIITGHGVSPNLIAAARNAATSFYALPRWLKTTVAMPSDRFRGYTAPGDLAVGASYGSDTPPDLKETFAIGPVILPEDQDYLASAGHFFAENMWPVRPASMRQSFTAYYLEMERLAAILMQLFALALGLPEAWFEDKIDKHISPLSAQYYPALTKPAVSGQLRAGMHTDFGSLTIVHRDASLGGLEVLSNGQWLAAPHVKDSFTVNLGDLMADWTNNRWVSTIHRVGVPPLDEGATSDRLSLCFFHQPNFDAEITPIPTCDDSSRPTAHSTITSGEHYYQKIRAMRGQVSST